MARPALTLVEDPGGVRAALSPLRRQLLALLVEPSSAPRLAEAIGLSRQKVGYHLRVLEVAGLVELVEEVPRRGVVERVVRATADAFVVDPGVIGEPTTPEDQDLRAADHLVRAAAGLVRDVSRQQRAADARHQRLLTFTIESEVRLGSPADVEPFAAALAAALSDVVRRFEDPSGRPLRLVVGAHPRPSSTSKERP